MISFRYISLLFSLFLTTGVAQAEYLRKDDLNSLVVSCYLEDAVPVFCSKQRIEKPHLKLYLPLFKSVIVDGKVHAFRIMATIENLTKRNLVGAKVKLMTRGRDGFIIEFIINEKVKYKMASTTKFSHLIRSDVPKIRHTYDILHSAYYNADISDFEMAITELYFD